MLSVVHLVRADRSYALPRVQVLRLAACADVHDLGRGVALASVEGLPVMVVEPEQVLQTVQGIGRDAETASVLPPPLLAVVVGTQGAVACALAADRAELCESSSAVPLTALMHTDISAETLRSYFGEL